MPTEKQNVTYIKKLIAEYEQDGEFYRAQQSLNPLASTELAMRAGQAEVAARALGFALQYITTGKSLPVE